MSKVNKPASTGLGKSSGKKQSKQSKYIDAPASTVEEAAVAYSSYKKLDGNPDTKHTVVHGNFNKDAIVILGNAANKAESRMTPIEKMSIVRSGVSKKDLERLKEKASLDYDKLAKALSVTRATLINKKGIEKFNAALSERIVGLADIYSYGFEVFEDEKRFNQWMFRPNQALGGEVPYDLLDNQFGREELKSIIGRIDYGVYS